MTLKVDAILFDMDGTLIDERPSYREAIRLTAARLLDEPVAAEEVEAVKRLPGFNNDWDATWAVVERRVHGAVAAPKAEDRASEAYLRCKNIFQTYYLGHRVWEQTGGVTAPFAWDDPLMARERPLMSLSVLDRLGGFTLGIATSRPRIEALMALRQHGMQRYFPDSAVVAMEDAAREKPDPAPLHELLRRVKGSRAVYVGDTINDALAARAASMPFIHIGNEPLGDPEIEYWVHARVSDPNEIESLCALTTAEAAR